MPPGLIEVLPYLTRDLSDATLRCDLALGVRRRHAPKGCPPKKKIDPRSALVDLPTGLHGYAPPARFSPHGMEGAQPFGKFLPRG